MKNNNSNDFAKKKKMDVENLIAKSRLYVRPEIISIEVFRIYGIKTFFASINFVKPTDIKN